MKKRKTLVVSMLLLFVLLTVVGLSTAEYYTKQIGFGGGAPPLLVKTDGQGVVWLQVCTLGFEKTWDLSPVLHVWERAAEVVSNFFRSRTVRISCGIVTDF